MTTPTMIVAYLALFAAAGFAFLFVNLLIGWLVRPDDPHAEKRETYECGEPTIGSSFVQFDLRFYVVALVFLVFDAEVAFLFPTATVFGKQVHMADADFPLVVAAAGTGAPEFTPDAARLLREQGIFEPGLPATLDEAGAATPIADATAANAALKEQSTRFAWFAFAGINVFFAVLVAGFAYEWKTGAFDWVRTMANEKKSPAQSPASPRLFDESAQAG